MNKRLPNRLENHKFEHYIGTWYAIDAQFVYDKNYNSRIFILWESEQYGDEAGHILTELLQKPEGLMFEIFDDENYDSIEEILQDHDII